MVSKLPTNCLSVFVHFVKLALKGLNSKIEENNNSNLVLAELRIIKKVYEKLRPKEI